jgi:hypothetical protein
VLPRCSILGSSRSRSPSAHTSAADIVRRPDALRQLILRSRRVRSVPLRQPRATKRQGGHAIPRPRSRWRGLARWNRRLAIQQRLNCGRWRTTVRQALREFELCADAECEARRRSCRRNRNAVLAAKRRQTALMCRSGQLCRWMVRAGASGIDAGEAVSILFGHCLEHCLSRANDAAWIPVVWGGGDDKYI